MTSDTGSPLRTQNTEVTGPLPKSSRFGSYKRQPREVDPLLKTDYLDDARWMELAQARGLTLPKLATPATQAAVAPWLTKLGMSREQFTDWCGFKNPTEWIEHNPHWSLRALVGLLLEECA